MKTKYLWHLLSNRWNSAITEYALSTAKALELKGYKSIFTVLEGSPAEQRARKMGFEVQTLKKFSIASIGVLRRSLDEWKPEKIFLYGGPETALAKFLGTKELVRFFGQNLSNRVLKFPFLFEWSYSHVQHFLVPNKILEDQILSRKSLKQKVYKVPLGLPYKEAGTLEKAPSLLILGRLDPIKGHREFFEIFSKMKESLEKQGYHPKLQIIGESANLSSRELRAALGELHLIEGKDFIIRDERVKNIEIALKESSVGVISSLGSEHICRVAEEFLLQGTPVFVSGAGATEEVLFEGAGASYKGLGVSEAAEQLRKLFLQSLEESEEQRHLRSSRAKLRFSLEAMSKTLADHLLLRINSF